VHLTITIPSQLMIWRWPSQNKFGMWTVLYWTRSSRTKFGESINVWRVAGDTLNITCKFLYCNHQVHRDVLIILYKYHCAWMIVTIITPMPKSQVFSLYVCTQTHACALCFLRAHYVQLASLV